ncbi:beta-1,3-galactosyltransferase 5-like [Mercenaria mercenaria]|uniref:beta-1,3-galactosyltransferase 5-like n=1 Tax=Mercenaria mercenaria TaxID=6596 RepID=UPI001E1DD145|nr:beta-1,3-galactosyltransferase 5-like [Mercenaria mercenaria]
MSKKMLQLFLRRGGGFIQSICVCTMLFIVLFTMNDTTRFANFAANIQQETCCKEKSLILSALSSNVKILPAPEQYRALKSLRNVSREVTKHVMNSVTKAPFQMDKYAEWIPHPQQQLSPLLDNPYVIQNSDICRRTKNLDVVVLIHSATGNFKRRQGIRSTWGNIIRQEENNMRIIFLLGLTENNHTQMRIVKENVKHNDIVQGNFVDTYHNLTHKAVLGLRWVKEFCPGDRRVLKVDDDVFLNTEKLHSVENKQDTIYCLRQNANTSIIQRMENYKWKVDKSEFKNHKYFPLPYCHGFFISMSTSMASKLYEAAHSMPFFWIDDFYVYGMLADKLGVSSNIVDMHHLLSLHTYDSLNCFGNENTKCNLLVGNAPSIEFMQSMWEKMLNQNKGVSGKIL